MPRHRRHHHPSSGPAAVTPWLVPGGGRNAATPTDPALMLSAGRGGGTAALSGSIAGLTPLALGAYLAEFYQGNFRNAASVWEMLARRDDMVCVCRRKRVAKAVRAIAGWDIIPIDDSPRAATHADFLRELYNNIRAEDAAFPEVRGGLRLLAELAMDAVAKQFALFAKDWSRTGGSTRLTVRRVPLWFFTADGGQFIFHPDQYGIDGTPVSRDEWLVCTRTEPVMEAVSVIAILKRMPMQQLVRVLEKWGVPNVYGKTSQEPGSASYNQLYEAVSAYISDMVSVISGDGEFVFPDSKFTAAALHKPWIDRCDEVIAINFLGGALSTKAQGDTGTLAGGAQADDIDDITADDAAWFSELCQEQIDRPAIAFEFGPGEEPLAYFSAAMPDKRDDANDRANVALGVSHGVPVGVGWFRERFAIPKPAADDELLTAPRLPGRSAFRPGNGAGAAASRPLLPPDGAKGTVPAPAAARRVAPRRPAPKLALCASPEGSGDARTASPVLALNARRAMRSAQADLDQLAANAVPAVRKAYAALLQPLLDSFAGAHDLAAATALISAYTPPDAARVAFAQIMADTTFAAVLRGYVADRPEMARNAGGAILAPPAPPETGTAGSSVALPVRRTAPAAAPQETALRASPEGSGDARTASPALNTDTAGAEYRPLPFDEARAFWAKKRLVRSFDDIAGATYAQAATYGFKVAGITEESALGMLRDDVGRAVQGGTTVADFTKAAQDKYGLTAKHAENVVRTNVQTTYAWGHYQQLNDPAVREAFPIWAFDVVKDDRTSDICAPLAGKAYPCDNVIWDSLYPPNHYQCRTGVYPLSSADEAAEQGFTVESTWPRDPDTGQYFMPQRGFESNVGTVPDLGNVLPDSALPADGRLSNLRDRAVDGLKDTLRKLTDDDMRESVDALKQLGVKTVATAGRADLAAEAAQGIAAGTSLGLPAPTTVRVSRKDFSDLTGDTLKRTVARTNPATGETMYNPDAPFWKLDTDARVDQILDEKRDGWQTTAHPHHWTLHELAHLEHGTVNPSEYRKDYGNEWFDARRDLGGVAKQYGLRYGLNQDHHRDFVADVRVGLKLGKTYPDQVMKYYRRFGGIDV